MTDIRLPQRINGEFADVPALTAPDIGKALTVASTTAFTYAAFATSADVAAAIATHIGLADPHTQYLLESAHAIASAVDFTDTTGAGTDGYSVTWDNDTGKFVLASVSGGGGTPGGSDTHVQRNSAGAFAGDGGFTYNGAGVATLSARLVVPKWSPAADSTTALQITKADGTTAVGTWDTINSRHSIGAGTGTQLFNVLGGDIRIDNGRSIRFRNGANTSDLDLFSLDVNNDFQIGTGGIAGITFQKPVQLLQYLYNFSTNLSLRSTGRFDFRDSAGALLATISQAGYANFGSNNTSPTAVLDLAASTTARASLRVRSGVAPTSPNDGDLWFDGTDFKARVGGVTKTFTLT